MVMYADEYETKKKLKMTWNKKLTAILSIKLTILSTIGGAYIIKSGSLRYKGKESSASITWDQAQF